MPTRALEKSTGVKQVDNRVIKINTTPLERRPLVRKTKKESFFFQLTCDGMLLIPGTGNGEPGTGVWEQVYSGYPLESSKWRSKQTKRLEEKQFGLR